MTLFILAIAPVIVCFSLVYWLDRHEREPVKFLIFSFIFGILSAIPAVLLEGFLPEVIGGTPGGGFYSTFIYALVVVAFSEEISKFAVVRLYMYWRKEFDEPFDGIMYCVAVSLGFAGIENILYVFGSDDPMSTAILRMFTAVPGHAMFGVLMGYYMGLAKFKQPGQRTMTIAIGILAAVVTHGAYDFFLFLGVEYLALLAFVVLIVGFILAFKAMRIHQRMSPHQGGTEVVPETVAESGFAEEVSDQYPGQS